MPLELKKEAGGECALTVQAIHNEPIDEVSYIINTNTLPRDSSLGGCVVVDPADFDALQLALQDLRVMPEYILLTHEHIDHISAVNELREHYPNCKVACSESCDERLKDPRANLSSFYSYILDFHGAECERVIDEYVVEGADYTFSGEGVIEWNGFTFHLIETPGHSPGSICIVVSGYLFTGDSLLRDNKAPTKVPGGNRKTYKEVAVPKIKKLPENLYVYPGHGLPFALRDSRYLV